MITPWIKYVKDYIAEKLSFKEKPKHRDNRGTREGVCSLEDMEDAKAYQEVLDRFRRENPEGIRLYD